MRDETEFTLFILFCFSIAVTWLPSLTSAHEQCRTQRGRFSVLLDNETVQTNLHGPFVWFVVPVLCCRVEESPIGSFHDPATSWSSPSIDPFQQLEVIH